MALSALAAEISKHAAILDEYIASNDLPAPSFSADGPLDFPIPSTASPELRASRTALLEATNSLFDLTTGPTTAIGWAGFHVCLPLLLLSPANPISTNMNSLPSALSTTSTSPKPSR
jgi:hypothetical protein